MQAKPRWFWVLILPVLVSILGVNVSTVQGAQNQQRVYFSETGHWVIGDFLTAYQSVDRPDLLYGLPITDAFISNIADGRRVQYFEYARFEYRPDNPPELQVIKSPLGKILYDDDSSGQVIPLPQGDNGCRYFSEAGFQVCYAFLDFFEKYGGIDQFGYPVSDLLQRDSILVQYFQFARMEWHPERPAGELVALTDVGRRYFNLFEDPRLAQPITNGAVHVIQSLQVQAFVSQPVVTSEGQQTVYVVVQDQSLSPVEGAVVKVSLRLPGDQQVSETALRLEVTDGKGIARISFPIQQQSRGLVEIVVEVSLNGSLNDLTQKTITSYRVWW